MGSFALLSSYNIFYTVVDNRNVRRCSYKVPDIVVQFYTNSDYDQVFVEISMIKFHANLCSGSHTVTLGQTDGQRRMEIYDDADRYFSLFMQTCLVN
jgi:hypothetical protein